MNKTNKVKHKNHGNDSIMDKPVKSLESICRVNAILNPYCKPGLQAIKKENRNKIIVPDTKLLGHSLDLDEALKTIISQDNRWDYGFEYEHYLIFIEIHPAETSQIDCICKKVAYTKEWLDINCPEILHLPKFEKGRRQYYWISSGRTKLKILPNSVYARKLAKNNIISVGNVFDYSKLKDKYS